MKRRGKRIVVGYVVSHTGKRGGAAEAARNLTNWNWLPMLNDNESPDTDHVRGDVKKLKEALEKVPR